MDDLAKPALISFASRRDRGEEIVATSNGKHLTSVMPFRTRCAEHRHRVLAHAHMSISALRLNMLDNENRSRTSNPRRQRTSKCMNNARSAGARHTTDSSAKETSKFSVIVADDDNLALGVLAREGNANA